MKLNLPYRELVTLFNLEDKHSNQFLAQRISIDSRSIFNGEETIFIALKGNFKDGHQFVQHAFDKGVRLFILSDKKTEVPENCEVIWVDDTLKALQKIAKHHREKFKNIPIIGITGSNGKTIVKEWLAQLLSTKMKVMRSPKSFNSQLGVALSLLELRPSDEVGIIEAGISMPSEMEILQKMIQPDIGIFTNIGKAHLKNFESQDKMLSEKLKLFKYCPQTFKLETVNLFEEGTFKNIPLMSQELKDYFLYKDEISIQNASIAIGVAKELGIENQQIFEELQNLRSLANRMEQFDGLNGNLIINDSYSLDYQALEDSLNYLVTHSHHEKNIVLIGLPKFERNEEYRIQQIVSKYAVTELHFIYPSDNFNKRFSNSCILIKGRRSAQIERIVSQLKLKSHATYLEVNLSSIRANIGCFKSQLNKNTKLLSMVKASSYGSSAEKMGLFLQQLGIDYLGVAYVDEGVDLRNAGVELPILVMNVDDYEFEQCTKNNLEPAIYSLEHLERFVTHLIHFNISHYPIHLKLETGMNRLGFVENEIIKLTSKILAQPEVHVKSIYSHLATADEKNDSFAKQQIATFDRLSSLLVQELGYSVIRHLLNTEGIIHYPEAQFDMVRLGIGMYGLTSDEVFNKNLLPTIQWKSKISQVKRIKKGESVGYSRGFVASEDMIIGIIPVGYADGYRRNLGNGLGEVIIKNERYPVIGNICMDMLMVDLKNNENISHGNQVELFGNSLSIDELAKNLNTIPYEVLTGISSRVSRVYITD